MLLGQRGSAGVTRLPPALEPRHLVVELVQAAFPGQQRADPGLVVDRLLHGAGQRVLVDEQQAEVVRRDGPGPVRLRHGSGQRPVGGGRHPVDRGDRGGPARGVEGPPVGGVLRLLRRQDRELGRGRVETAAPPGQGAAALEGAAGGGLGVGGGRHGGVGGRALLDRVVAESGRPSRAGHRCPRARAGRGRPSRRGAPTRWPR